HPEPYVIAAVNVTAADSVDEAQRHFADVARERVRSMASRGRTITDEQLDAIMDSPSGRQIVDMLRYNAIGISVEVKAYLDEFVQVAQADELMISLQSPDTETTARSMEILADAWI